MVFDDEMDFKMNEDTTSKNTEPQLEKYGVWIKKGPESLESPQEIPEINDIPDIPETTDFSEISDIEQDISAPESEQIESIDDEINSLMDANPTVIEESSSIVSTSEEPQIPVDSGLPEGFDIPGIDLSAFENNDIPAPKPSEPEGEVSIDMDDFFSSDSGDGDVDLSSFFGDGESIDFDDFMGGDSGAKKEPEFLEQEPLNIQLEFDDDFVLETKADSLSQVEFVGLDGESGEMSFDDLFDNIQDEGGISASDFDIPSGDTPNIPSFDPSSFETEDFTSAFMSDTPSVDATPATESKSSDTAYDDASEFDDLLSSLDDATPLTETPEEAKTKKLTQDYDITVTMDEEDLSEETEENNDEDNDDWDDISLFQSNEDIERFKRQSKNNGAPVGGMKVLEAQSSMDFDEIDKILEEGGFSFPSDDAKEESVEEVSIDDSNDVTAEDFSVESNEEPAVIEETQIEPSEEISLEDDLNVNFDENEVENTNSVIADDMDDNISFAPTLDEPVIQDSVEDEVTEEPSINLEPDFDEPVIQDSVEEEVIEEPSIDLEPDFNEPVIQDSVEDEVTEEPSIDVIADDELDESFRAEENLEETSPIEEETHEVIQEQEDDLLDMDFQENSVDETSEEQGETMIDEQNNIIEDEQKVTQPETTANAILEKIAAEISSLRSEITTLRSEFNSMKTTPIQETEAESLPEDKEESSGFFSDDGEDETIALSGDELNNILNNADFTTEDSDGETEESEVEDSYKEETEEEITEDEGIAEPETVVEELEEEETLESEPISEDIVEEFPSNPLGDTTELTDSDLDTMDEYEDDNFATDSETSSFADEDLTEPELDDLKIDNGFDENDEDLEDEIDIPKDEEVLEEQESNDFIDSINEVEPTISETLTEDRLKYLEDLAGDEEEPAVEEIAEETENLEEEPVAEPEEELLEEPEVEESIEEPSVEPELEETIVDEPEVTEPEVEEDEENEHNEPTEDVFNSPQWDNEVPTVAGVIAESEEAIEEVEESIEEPSVEPELEETIIDEPVITEPEVEETTPTTVEEPVKQEQPVVSPTPSVQPATAKIQDDIKSVLVYMDQLLENLPEDKIEEFARSEHFDTYKKLFSELGISN